MTPRPRRVVSLLKAGLPTEIKDAIKATIVVARSHVFVGRKRQLPSFIIIGAQRSGTTSLFNYLSQHPNVTVPLHKEIHFFDRDFHRGLNWYGAHFPAASACARVGAVTCEASPYYLYSDAAPERASAILPDARLVLLVRNPIDRAYSNYHHRLRKTPAYGLSFDDAIERELAFLSRRPVFDERAAMALPHQGAEFLAKGVYAPYLRRWLKHFDAKQIHVIPSEKLFSAPDVTLSHLFEFLELREAPIETSEIWEHAPAEQPMAAETRERLGEFFRPHNSDLSALTGITLPWGAAP